MITADDGRFRFDDLAPGKYALSAQRRGYPTQGWEEHQGFSTAVAVGPGKQSTDLVFRLTPAASLQVAVLDVNAGAEDFSRAGLPPECAQHVLMNPPFNDPMRQNASPDPGRRHAHTASHDTLAQWMDRASLLLVQHGTLTLIWRASGLAEVLTAVAGFGGITLLPIHPKPQAAAIRVIVRAVKGSAAPLVLLPALTLNDADGKPSAAAEAILRNGACLRSIASQ